MLQVDDGASKLWIGLYLPESGLIEGEAGVELELGNGSNEILLRGR